MGMECSSWKRGSLLVDNVTWMTLYSRVGAMVPRPGNIRLLCTLGLPHIIHMSWYLTALTPHKVKRNKLKLFGERFQNILRENGLSERLEIFNCLFNEDVSFMELLCLSVKNTHAFE